MKRKIVLLLAPKNCVLKLSFSKLKNIQVEQETQLKLRKNQNLSKRDLKGKLRQETQKRERIDEKQS